MKVCLNHYDTLLNCINQIEHAVLPLLVPYHYEKLAQKNFHSKDKKLNINSAIKFLETQGYKVS